MPNAEKIPETAHSCRKSAFKYHVLDENTLTFVNKQIHEISCFFKNTYIHFQNETFVPNWLIYTRSGSPDAKNVLRSTLSGAPYTTRDQLVSVLVGPVRHSPKFLNCQRSGLPSNKNGRVLFFPSSHRKSRIQGRGCTSVVISMLFWISLCIKMTPVVSLVRNVISTFFFRCGFLLNARIIAKESEEIFPK